MTLPALSRHGGIVLALSLLIAPTIAIAESPAGIVSAQDRSFDGDRVALVQLENSRLETAVDIGRIAAMASGGLLDYLIITAADDRREIMTGRQKERAEALAGPIRAALATTDVPALAMSTTRTAFAAAPWLRVRDVVFGATPPPVATVKDAATPRLVSVKYRYELSPDCTQLRVFARLTLDRRADAAEAPTFERLVTSIVQLRNRSYTPADNVEQWAADDGRQARLGLTAGFKALERLIPYTLGLDAAEVKALSGKSRPQAQGAGFYGTLVSRDAADPDRVLIWSNGPVDVQAVASGR